MSRRLMLAAVAGCFAGGGFAETAPVPPVADEARLSPPAVPLVEVCQPDIDPAGYLVSEKFDGVRAIWDGRELRFRSGRRVPAPAWFLAGLPRQALDGELWLGRGRFDELSGIVRKTRASGEAWRDVRYLVFEMPGEASFADRSQRIATVVEAAGVPWLGVVEQRSVADRKELLDRLEEVLRGGGEGLVLHRAAAPYAPGRSGDLLKLKRWRDAEATVVGYERGHGRLAGTIGALRLRTPEGTEFRVGSGLSDGLRRQPPAVGTRVAYRYQELTKDGVPRFPRYWRVSPDF